MKLTNKWIYRDNKNTTTPHWKYQYFIYEIGMRWDAHRKKKFFLQKICEKKIFSQIGKKRKKQM